MKEVDNMMTLTKFRSIIETVCEDLNFTTMIEHYYTDENSILATLNHGYTTTTNSKIAFRTYYHRALTLLQDNFNDEDGSVRVSTGKCGNSRDFSVAYHHFNSELDCFEEFTISFCYEPDEG